jgi:hypothetical protein
MMVAEVRSMTACEIANLIERLMSYYVIAAMGFGIDRGSTMRLGRRYDTYYEGVDVYAAQEAVHGSGYNLDFLGTMLSVALLWIGDALTRASYFDRAPVLEFIRHLRNAVAHGNVFNLVNGEPRRPARFRQFEITANLHGTPVLFEYMMGGDIFDLFDDVVAHLRQLSI